MGLEINWHEKNGSSYRFSSTAFGIRYAASSFISKK